MSTILVIDDDYAQLSVMRRAFTGWTILIAPSSAAAQETLRAQINTLDVVLLALTAPRIDALAVYREARRYRQDLAIILTAIDSGRFSDIPPHPCTLPLPKPFTASDLLSAIRTLLPAPSSTSQATSTSAPIEDTPSEAHLLDLNIGLIQQHITTAVNLRGLEGPTDPYDYLAARGLITEEGQYSTLAGVLLFADDPNHWLAQAGIDLARFNALSASTLSRTFQNQVRGPITSVIDRAVDILWGMIDHTATWEGTSRIDMPEYPLVVLRELTVNALAHRNWSDPGARVRILLFPDRIEWISPGLLPPGVTPANLRNAQTTRNPHLAQALYDAGKIESFGLGIDTVEDTLTQQGFPPLVVEEQDAHLIVRVYARSKAPLDTTSPQERRRDAIRTVLRAAGRPLKRSEIQALLPGMSERSLLRDLEAMARAEEISADGATNRRLYKLTKPTE